MGRITTASSLEASAKLVTECGGLEFDRATQITGRCSRDRTSTLGERHATDAFTRNRTTDVQTVVVTVRHVAERYAIQREAHLVLVETTHDDSRRPFISAKRIGRLEIHTRQFLDRFQRTRTRREEADLFSGDRLLLPGDATREDDDLFKRVNGALVGSVLFSRFLCAC